MARRQPTPPRVVVAARRARAEREVRREIDAAASRWIAGIRAAMSPEARERYDEDRRNPPWRS
jgi:hypothetical protein